MANDNDADCFYDDTTAPPVTDANDGMPDEAGGDDTPAVDPRSDAATKKWVAEGLPGMALNQRGTRRMASCLARQTNFPSEHNEVGQPNWRGGEGGAMSAMMKLLTRAPTRTASHFFVLGKMRLQCRKGIIFLRNVCSYNIIQNTSTRSLIFVHAPSFPLLLCLTTYKGRALI